MLDRLKALRDKPWTVALLVFVAAQLLFAFHLGRPSRILFDETHYIPAAKAILAMDVPRNPEHPMLGKTLLAGGIALFGDNPYGWRSTTTLAGSASVVAIFAFLWLLLGRMRYALLGAACAMLNQTLFVQARTGMLDVFLGVLVLWALVVFLWAMRGTPKQVRWRWVLGSALLGLAVGVKWAAIPYVALAGLAFVVIRLRDQMTVRPELVEGRPSTSSGRTEWRKVLSSDQPHWPGLATIPALAIMGSVSIAVYFATFWPGFFFRHGTLTFAQLIPLQLDMYRAQTQVLAAHNYQSDWWSWPLMIRPIWYFYEWDEGFWRGVLLIGNPLIMWGGLAGVLACYWFWFKDKAIRPLAVALLWTASVAIYIVIPKSLGFYYYYHLSGLFLCLVLPVAFHQFDRGRGKGYEEWFAAASLLVFAYFYPIIAASPLASGAGFNYWMWFPSWR